jgi:hypothetical protein
MTDPMDELPLRYGVEVGEGETAIRPDLDDLYTRTKIDPNDLDGELVEQSGLYSWWSVLASEADFESDMADRSLGIVEAQATARLKAAGEAATIIGKLVKGEPEYVEALGTYLLAKRSAAIMRGVLRTLEHRREMLVALCHRRNKEFGAARDSI